SFQTSLPRWETLEDKCRGNWDGIKAEHPLPHFYSSSQQAKRNNNSSYPSNQPPTTHHQVPLPLKPTTHTTSHVSLQVQQEQDRLCCHHPCSDPSCLPQRAASRDQDDAGAGPQDGDEEDRPGQPTQTNPNQPKATPSNTPSSSSSSQAKAHTTSHVPLQVQQEPVCLCCHHPSPDPSVFSRWPASCSSQDDPRSGP
ncbi:MAG: hypothetical protein JOS17DRAFT_823228, partial [Linnemannia elongata]